MTKSLATQARPGLARKIDSRVLDTAVGILIGWRRYSTNSAFEELMSVSERHRVPLFALADALVSPASREETSAAVRLLNWPQSANGA